MTLSERLASDLKDAMRARDDARLRALRGLTAALKSAEIDGRTSGKGALDEAGVLAVVQKQAKQRRESIAQFDAAGRDDLSAVEREELAVIDAYLPQQLSDDDIAAVVREIVASVGAAGPSDMGKVMGPTMARLRGQADGGRVQAAVKAALAG